MVTKPKKLQKGDTIGVVGTSYWADPQKLQQAETFLKGKGYKVVFHPNNALRYYSWAGTEVERAEAFTEYWNDPSIKAIIAARGGLRGGHMLDHLDFSKLSGSKIFLGYSDNTALLSALYTKKNMVGFHGPIMTSLTEDTAEDDWAITEQILSGEDKVELPMNGTQSLYNGTCQGTLFGGNLCVISYLLGSDYIKKFDDVILFLEDIGEYLSNTDRMFLMLQRLGQLKNIKGLIIGRFTEIHNYEDRPFPFDIADLVKEYTKGLKIPVVMDAPFGHNGSIPCYPVGIRAKLTVDGQSASLITLEKATV